MALRPLLLISDPLGFSLVAKINCWARSSIAQVDIPTLQVCVVWLERVVGRLIHRIFGAFIAFLFMQNIIVSFVLCVLFNYLCRSCEPEASERKIGLYRLPTAPSFPAVVGGRFYGQRAFCLDAAAPKVDR